MGDVGRGWGMWDGDAVEPKRFKILPDGQLPFRRRCSSPVPEHGAARSDLVLEYLRYGVCTIRHNPN